MSARVQRPIHAEHAQYGRNSGKSLMLSTQWVANFSTDSANARYAVSILRTGKRGQDRESALEVLAEGT